LYRRRTLVLVSILIVASFALASVAPRLTGLGTFGTKPSLESLGVCNGAEGSRSNIRLLGGQAIGLNGIHYVTLDVTGRLDGSAPGPILLKTPISFNGVIFSSPNRSAFPFVYTAGFLFLTLKFVDGSQNNLSEIMFPPMFSVPGGCAEVVIHNGQEAGFVVYADTTSSPAYPDLAFQLGDSLYQVRVYAIVRS